MVQNPDSVNEAETWMEGSAACHNHEHSKVDYRTPESKHCGMTKAMRD